jgi:hypothetical protein
MRILECHSKGDRRFSALYARLADGRTIETVYQSAKRDANGLPYPKGQAKGKPAQYIHILGKNHPCSHTLKHTFYTMLWWIWLIENPELAEEAAGYDVFIDIYDGHRGQRHLKGIETPFPKNLHESACQARAIAFLVGDGNMLSLPSILRQALNTYWLRYHKQPFTQDAQMALDNLLSIDRNAFGSMDQDRIRQLITKLDEII